MSLPHIRFLGELGLVAGMLVLGLKHYSLNAGFGLDTHSLGLAIKALGLNLRLRPGQPHATVLLSTITVVYQIRLFKCLFKCRM